MDSKYIKALAIYYCGRETCECGHSFGPAIRQHYLLHIILEGSGKFYNGKRWFHLKKGDVFLIEPSQKTYYEASSKAPWEYAWAGFDGYEVPHILQRCGFTNETPVFRDSLFNRNDLFSSITTLAKTFQDGNINSYKLLGHLYLLFSCMYQDQKEDSHHSLQTDYLHKAKNYITHNYGYDIKVEDIAKHIGIDRTYLYKIFKREEGTSPQQYLIEFRLKAAMNMLLNPALSITEIAFSCGFRDAPSFCKHFKKRNALTPKHFRLGANHSTTDDTSTKPPSDR